MEAHLSHVDDAGDNNFVGSFHQCTSFGSIRTGGYVHQLVGVCESTHVKYNRSSAEIVSTKLAEFRKKAVSNRNTNTLVDGPDNFLNSYWPEK